MTKALFILCVSVLLAFSCARNVKTAMEVHSLKYTELRAAPSDRHMQTRVFAQDKQSMMRATAALLQDWGYTLDVSEPLLGLVVGSKRTGAPDDIFTGIEKILYEPADPLEEAVQPAALVVFGAEDAAAAWDASWKQSEALWPEPGKQMWSSVAGSPRRKLEEMGRRVENFFKGHLGSGGKGKDVSIEERMKDWPKERPLPPDRSFICTRVCVAITAIGLSFAEGSKAAGDNGQAAQSVVRVLFQYTQFYSPLNERWKEQIKQLAWYEDFFDKLAQAVFLEAHGV